MNDPTNQPSAVADNNGNLIPTNASGAGVSNAPSSQNNATDSNGNPVQVGNPSLNPQFNYNPPANGGAIAPISLSGSGGLQTPQTPITPPTQNPVDTGTTANSSVSVPSTADIINKDTQSTPTQGTQSDILGKVASLMQGKQSLATLQFNQENQQGVTSGLLDVGQTLNGLNAQLTGLNDQATKLQNDASAGGSIENQNQNYAEGRGVTAGALSNMTAGALRTNQIQQAAITSQALTVKALITATTAKQGNLMLVKDIADKAAQVQFDATTQEINYQQSLLAQIQPQLDKEQKAQADQLTADLADRQKQVDAQISNKSAAITEVAKYANVASAELLTKMASAPDAASVTAMAAQAGIQQPTAGRYKDVAATITDAFGNQQQVIRVMDTTTGKFVNGGAPSGSYGGSTNTPVLNLGGAGANSITSGSNIVGSGGAGTGAAKLPFAEYGLLANTDLNPTAPGQQGMVDGLVQKYIQSYLQNGSVPTASTLGRNMKPGAVAEIDSRARDVYFQATGHAMPSPQYIQQQRDLLTSNNKLANNLKIQEQTVQSNVNLSIANMKSSNINSSQFAPLNSLIDTVQNMFNDPNIGQMLAQNTTIQNELGSLLAVKNASGTTVYDKMTSAGIISPTDTQANITQKVNALMKEAANFADSIGNANADIYKQIDPLVQDPNNPMVAHMQVENALNSQNINYNDVLSRTPQGTFPAMETATGKVVYLTDAEYQSSKYTKL